MDSAEDAKQVCILDTNFLLRMCGVELGTKRAIDWLLQDFQVFVPFSDLTSEARNNILTFDDETQDVYNRVWQLIGYTQPIASCQQFVAELLEQYIRTRLYLQAVKARAENVQNQGTYFPSAPFTGYRP